MKEFAMSKICWISGLALLSWCAVATAQDGVSLSVGASPPAPAVEYWLGIQVLPVPQAVRDQLGISGKEGLLVEEVVPNSPAAKAGVAKHDVLLRAGEKSLREPRELVAVIEATKEGKIKLDLIHGGKPKTIEAAPAKRPKEFARPPAAVEARDWETMQQWLDRMYSGEPGAAGRPSMRFRFFHPGAIVPNEAFAPASMPSDMSIVISKQGDQPADIVVKQGDKKWEAKENKLEKLPAEVRTHVERLLGRGPFAALGGSPAIDVLPEMASPGDKSTRGNVLDRLERRFDEMNRRVDRLLQALEGSPDRPEHPTPGKPAEK
jgi:hypothetical protein